MAETEDTLQPLGAGTLEAVWGCSTFEDLVGLAEERSHKNFQAIDSIHAHLYTDVRRLHISQIGGLGAMDPCRHRESTVERIYM